MQAFKKKLKLDGLIDGFICWWFSFSIKMTKLVILDQKKLHGISYTQIICLNELFYDSTGHEWYRTHHQCLRNVVIII